MQSGSDLDTEQMLETRRCCPDTALDLNLSM
jgi:hypothetical protein